MDPAGKPNFAQSRSQNIPMMGCVLSFCEALLSSSKLTNDTNTFVSSAVLLAHLQALALQLPEGAPPAAEVQSPFASPFAAADLPPLGPSPLGSLSIGDGSLPFSQNHSLVSSLEPQVSPPAVSLSRRGSTRARRNEEQVRRTVYISDIDGQASEQQLAAFFADFGPIVDCRICGDPNSTLRFGFIEFLTELSATAALSHNGALFGASPLRVSPSKTAIVPVNNQFLPRSEEERLAVARTVYIGNIHQTVERDTLRAFFQNLCGPVAKIRLLGDSQHDTKIAFVEFATLEGAAAAVRCTGAMLGPLPIRVAPSKTPVRGDVKRRGDGQAFGGAMSRQGSLQGITMRAASMPVQLPSLDEIFAPQPDRAASTMLPSDFTIDQLRALQSFSS